MSRATYIEPSQIFWAGIPRPSIRKRGLVREPQALHRLFRHLRVVKSRCDLQQLPRRCIPMTLDECFAESVEGESGTESIGESEDLTEMREGRFGVLELAPECNTPVCAKPEPLSPGHTGLQSTVIRCRQGIPRSRGELTKLWPTATQTPGTKSHHSTSTPYPPLDHRNSC